jgi:molybdopterin molybdotransferase
VSALPVTLKVAGESAAGHPFAGSLGPGETVRIFTGAPVPPGGDRIIIQEDAEQTDGQVVIGANAEFSDYIRPKGFDFTEGERLLAEGTVLKPRDVLLAAAMNYDLVPVRRRPRVAILATGDELKPPGTTRLDEGQIISSIPYGLSPLIEKAGGVAERLGIANDDLASLAATIDKSRQSDILLTIGGASVGARDLVQQALKTVGFSLGFWKIAMRPGKPLIFGTLAEMRVLGVPGNPVSAMICARVFLVPMIRGLLGLDPLSDSTFKARLASDIEANGPRQHYMRATLAAGTNGERLVAPLESQDSSLIATLARADCLIVRPPNAPALTSEQLVDVMSLDF